jgi:hypothetical protein
MRPLNSTADVTLLACDRVQAGIDDRLGERGRLDWSRASLDSLSVRAKRGAA